MHPMTWTEVLRSNWPDSWVREIAGFLGFVALVTGSAWFAAVVTP